MTSDPIRAAAWEILRGVERGQPLDPLLDRARSRAPADRRPFLSELVKGSLVYRGRYDHLIRAYSRRGGLPKVRERILLRLGLHQLLACDSVPAYAAVDQSVTLAKSVLGSGQSGFINAVLSAVSRDLAAAGGEVEALKRHFPDPDRSPAAFIAHWHSHPQWLVERWIDRFGPRQTEALCRFNNAGTRPTFHVLAPHDPVALRDRLSDAGIRTGTSPLCDRALVSENLLSRNEIGGILEAMPELIVQDATVQAASAWLMDGARGRRLDMCAAPGGKTVHARAVSGPGSGLVAMDLRPRRMRRVAENLRRTGLDDVPLLAADALRAPFRGGRFDTVMLDGPCSGTGVIRHHPEGRWRLDPKTLEANADRLLALARAAHSLLAPGGRLLYSTCSLEPEENTDVLEALVRETPGLDYAVDGSRDASMRWWLPQTDGADGFFAAKLCRGEAT